MILVTTIELPYHELAYLLPPYQPKYVRHDPFQTIKLHYSQVVAGITPSPTDSIQKVGPLSTNARPGHKT